MKNHNETELKKIIVQHYTEYPLMQISDMLKLLYQNEFGCGHMAPEKTQSLNMIKQEILEINKESTTNSPLLIEEIGNGLCRLNLQMLKKHMLKPETLNSLFILTANKPMGSREGFNKKTDLLLKMCEEGIISFDSTKLALEIEKHRKAGYPAIGHSNTYRSAYKPAYRVVEKSFCNYIPLFAKIDELKQKQIILKLAIDGNSAAGKSTLAQLLKDVYDCNVISMDDYFLQPFQRTRNRLNEVGGNIDYERFEKEIINPLRNNENLSCQAYDCQTEKLGKPKIINTNGLTVIEGVYSLHPKFIKAYDIKVFLKISPEDQRLRLIDRNKNLLQRFTDEWIPMEKKYFETFKIVEKSDFVFNA